MPPTPSDTAAVDTAAVNTVAADNASGAHPFVGARRALAASLVGTAIEFYDFYVYATAASLVLGAHFFPASSPSAQLLAA